MLTISIMHEHLIFVNKSKNNIRLKESSEWNPRTSIPESRMCNGKN